VYLGSDSETNLKSLNEGLHHALLVTQRVSPVRRAFCSSVTEKSPTHRNDLSDGWHRQYPAGAVLPCSLPRGKRCARTIAEVSCSAVQRVVERLKDVRGDVGRCARVEPSHAVECPVLGHAMIIIVVLILKHAVVVCLTTATPSGTRWDPRVNNHVLGARFVVTEEVLAATKHLSWWWWWWCVCVCVGGGGGGGIRRMLGAREGGVSASASRASSK
jgi:hypothetical protein